MVDVILAGYNVDADVLGKYNETLQTGRDMMLKLADKIEKAERPIDLVAILRRGAEEVSDVLKLPLTPEVITAAYARISRDPKPIPELRKESSEEVKAARASNAKIIYGMGHGSIGNHALFNFDVLDLSRRAVEALESGRMGVGITEKSQRYIKLDGDYVVPSELCADDIVLFRDLVENVQNRFYLDNIDRVIEYHFEMNPALAAISREKANKGMKPAVNSEWNQLTGYGKEDTRYSLGLSAAAQIGFSATATALEKAHRRMKYSDSAEERDLAEKLKVAFSIAPSLGLYSDLEAFEERFSKPLEDGMFKYSKKERVAAVANLLKDIPLKDVLEAPSRCAVLRKQDDITLVDCADRDVRVLTAILHGNSQMPIDTCVKIAEYVKTYMGPEGKTPIGPGFMREVLNSLTEHDDPSREFEFSDGFMFEIVGSASFFAQAKRHRVASIVAQQYDIRRGITVPKSIKEVGLEPKLWEVAEKSETLYAKFDDRYGPAVAEYCLMNAHQRRVLMGFNARQLHHFVALRCDDHAQWDIREKAFRMKALANNAAPLTLMLTHGKSEFKAKRKELYGA